MSGRSNRGGGFVHKKRPYCDKRKIMDYKHIQMYVGAQDCPNKHIRYEWPSLERENSLIVADSLLRRVRHLRWTVVHAVPGANIERIISDITRGIIDVSKFLLICVHLGTNNLESDTAQQICNRMSTLFDVIRARNATCKILFSGIVIRPQDEDYDRVYTKEGKTSLAAKRREANSLIADMLRVKGGTQLETWKSLMKGHHANQAMYEDDGLHLTTKGVARIRQFLINCIANALRFP